MEVAGNPLDQLEADPPVTGVEVKTNPPEPQTAADGTSHVAETSLTQG